MARHARVASRAVEETLDVVVAVGAYRRAVDRAIADGRVDGDERRRIARRGERVEQEAREATHLAEVVDLLELTAAAVLTGCVNPHLRERAAEAGIALDGIHLPPIVELFPDDRDAA